MGRGLRGDKGKGKGMLMNRFSGISMMKWIGSSKATGNSRNS